MACRGLWCAYVVGKMSKDIGMGVHRGTVVCSLIGKELLMMSNSDRLDLGLKSLRLNSSLSENLLRT